MNCAEPHPDRTYAGCDKELKHRGDHGYFGEYWPRVKPFRGDWDINELLDDATPRDMYDVMERSFPVVVTETTVRVIWVEAESEDDALGRHEDGWDDDIRDAQVLDSSLEFSRPDRFQRSDAMIYAANRSDSRIGPLLACPDCGHQGFRRHRILHNPWRKCHGQFTFRTGYNGRLIREFTYGGTDA